ncbi:MAG: Trk system potassium transport protein TrkA [Balneolaceae bacterium]
MKIVIIGAGDVGFELSKILSDEKHDVVVVDQNPESLKKISDHQDVLVLEGNATSPVDLINARVKGADVMLAVTNIDEVNIVSSVMAKRLGAKTVIARVRNDELSRPDSPLSPSELGIDILIHPELAAAHEIKLLLKRASATDVVSLADGKLQLIGLRLKSSSKLNGMNLAELADTQAWNIKLIESDLNVATSLAGELKNVLVLHGNPTDPNLLVTEGISEMDAFISVTADEESNIISCLMAKHLEVKKTVAIVSKPEYIPLSETIGLDAAINVKASASDEIHRCIRRGNITTIKALKGIRAEVFEVVASNKCKVVNRPLKKLKMPDGSILGGIIKQNGAIEIATGNSIIHEGDKVIVFALPYAIYKVIALFQ